VLPGGYGLQPIAGAAAAQDRRRGGCRGRRRCCLCAGAPVPGSAAHDCGTLSSTIDAGLGALAVRRRTAGTGRCCPLVQLGTGVRTMQFGVMNDPRKRLLEEIERIARHGFDFIDLTIEAPGAAPESTDWAE